MDQKTLEYMGARVDKAREIKKKIAELEHFIKYSEGKSNIKVRDQSHNGPEIEYRDFPRLAVKAKEAVIKEVEAEIELLQQELTEL